MKIDLAVFTSGSEGYDWFVADGVYERRELATYRRTIGHFPNVDLDEIPFGGAFNEGEWIIFYRYHVAYKGGEQGRDAIYLVLGRVPLAVVEDVDFKCAFALEEMAIPHKPTPTCMTYAGPKAGVNAPDFMLQRRYDGFDSLSYIGKWFATMPVDGKLKVSIDRNASDISMRVRFEPVMQTKPPVSLPSKPPVPDLPNFSPKAMPQNKRSHFVWSFAVIAILAFILGVGIGYWLHDVHKGVLREKKDVKMQPTRTLVEQDQEINTNVVIPLQERIPETHAPSVPMKIEKHLLEVESQTL